MKTPTFKNNTTKLQVLKVVEDDLFQAMELTLQMLREIHESKGEVIQDYNFTKRELTTKQ